ncbi:MAG: alanine racemase [Oscillospiraceae bacterium]
MEFLKRSWAEINLDALKMNIENVKKTLKPTTKMLGVVKADAYGHGAVQVAEQLLKLGVEWIGVSNIHEGMALRNRGISVPILIFGITPPELADELAEFNITQTVFCLEYAQALQIAAKEKNIQVDIHIKIDTGMARIGFDGFVLEEAVKEITEISHFKNLHQTGIFTHFSISDEDTDNGNEYTKQQYNRFIEVCNTLEKNGVNLGIRHACNSGGVLNHLDMQLDMVRLGIVMYGMNPDKTTIGKLELYPVMSLHSSISMVKDVPKGRKISYGCTYETTKPMKIATVPIGYADGYSRLLSGKGVMIVDGEYAPVIGRVCMDQLMIDVTDIPNVNRNSEVIVVGKCGNKKITMEDWADKIGTVNYEICCLISKRMPRVYIKNGEITEIIDMIV